MDNKQLILKCVEKLKELPNNQYTSFYELVVDVIGLDKVHDIKDLDLFNLCYQFDDLVKKSKINIKYRCSIIEPVGQPYDAEFCKLEPSKVVKSITLYYSYSAWIREGHKVRKCITFTPSLIKYKVYPLFSRKSNAPRMTITIDPFVGDGKRDFISHYNLDFDNFCRNIVPYLKNGNAKICDVISPSITVTYLDGHKETFENLSSDDEGFNSLNRLAQHYLYEFDIGVAIYPIN